MTDRRSFLKTIGMIAVGCFTAVGLTFEEPKWRLSEREFAGVWEFIVKNPVYINPAVADFYAGKLRFP